MLKLLGNVEHWIGDVEFFQHLVGGRLHHLRARVEILVDAVAEAHQAERIILVLGARNIFRDALHVANLAQHVERSLVGPAMRRSPQAGDACRHARKRVRAR